MTVEELIDILADLPDKALACPLVIETQAGWSTIKTIRFDEDRLLFGLEPL